MIILEKQLRSTQSVSDILDLPGNWFGVEIRILCDDWATPGKTLDVLIEQSVDDGQTYSLWMDTVLETGVFTRDGSLPYWYFEEHSGIPKKAKVTITPSEELEFGLEANIL